jgi:hypothetical protein
MHRELNTLFNGKNSCPCGPRGQRFKLLPVGSDYCLDVVLVAVRDYAYRIPFNALATNPALSRRKIPRPAPRNIFGESPLQQLTRETILETDWRAICYGKGHDASHKGGAGCKDSWWVDGEARVRRSISKLTMVVEPLIDKGPYGFRTAITRTVAIVLSGILKRQGVMRDVRRLVNREVWAMRRQPGWININWLRATRLQPPTLAHAKMFNHIRLCVAGDESIRISLHDSIDKRIVEWIQEIRRIRFEREVERYGFLCVGVGYMGLVEKASVSEFKAAMRKYADQFDYVVKKTRFSSTK